MDRLGRIRNINTKLKPALKKLKDDLSSWLERAKATNALFSYLADSENVQIKKRFSARGVAEDVRKQVEVLARGVPIVTTRLSKDVSLPKASIVEWGSVFQNVFINAFNAVTDSEKKLIDVSSRVDGSLHEILIQDTGCGVDLRNAESLFEPFERKLKISPQRRALAYGGTGLGLTIVRLLARNIGCRASFVEPEKGYSTAFSLSWEEK